MIVVMRSDATEEDIQQVCQMLEEAGYKSAIWRGVERTVIGAIGVIDEEVKSQLIEQIGSLPAVENVIRILATIQVGQQGLETRTDFSAGSGQSCRR
jgi:3-deoxy-7-phosphoheptulonate synthase